MVTVAEDTLPGPKLAGSRAACGHVYVNTLSSVSLTYVTSAEILYPVGDETPLILIGVPT